MGCYGSHLQKNTFTTCSSLLFILMLSFKFAEFVEEPRFFNETKFTATSQPFPANESNLNVFSSSTDKITRKNRTRSNEIVNFTLVFNQQSQNKRRETFAPVSQTRKNLIKLGTEIPVRLRIVDNRSAPYVKKLRRGDGNGPEIDTLEQNAWKRLNSIPLHRFQQSSSAHWPLQKLRGVHSPPTAASNLFLHTRLPEKIETSLESPIKLDLFSQNPLMHFVKVPLVDLRLSQMEWAKTPNKLPFHLSNKEKSPARPWIKPEKDSIGSDAIPHTHTEVTLRPIAEKVIPHVAEKESSYILLNVWLYTNEGLQLEVQKRVPTGIFTGYSVSDGQVVNIEQIPHPIRKNVESAFNLTSSLIKRHSGPGSMDAFHWMQLPSVIAPTVPPTLLPFIQTQKPLELNYVVWSGSTPPPPQQSLSDLLLGYVSPPIRTPHNLVHHDIPIYHQTTKPPNFGANKVKDSDILTNVASMALILSKINRDVSRFEQTSRIPFLNSNSAKFPSEFWSSLLPVYLHHLGHGKVRRPGRLSHRRKKKPTTLKYEDTDYIFYPDISSEDYSFYPIQGPGTNPEQPAKTGLFKKNLKKRKKKKKKKKKSKKHLSSFHHDHLDLKYSFWVHILGMIQKGFYTILALKAAPFVILGILTALPFGIIAATKLIKGVKLGEVFWQILRHFKNKPAKKTHHHYYTAPYHHIHNEPHHGGWHPSGWTGTEHYRRLEGGNDEYLASRIGSLVQATYGNGRQNGSNPGEKGVTEGYVLYDTELDTKHNRKVMEILMQTKNATLQKLLESWEINFSAPKESRIDLAEVNSGKKQRKRREWKGRSGFYKS